MGRAPIGQEQGRASLISLSIQALAERRRRLAPVCYEWGSRSITSSLTTIRKPYDHLRPLVFRGSKTWDNARVPPETRASFAQQVQDTILDLPVEQSEPIKSLLGSVWDEIAAVPKVAWLSESTYNALTEAVRLQLGDTRTIALYRKVGRRILSNPGFQSFVELAIRLFGVSPHSLLKMIPRGRESVVRNSGTLTYEWISERRAQLRLRDFPASTFSTGTTVVLLTGTFWGVLDVAGAEATASVTTEQVDLAAGNAIFHLGW